MLHELKQLIDDPDRAVSPVIGVILMVAITVILAAVIGTFVLDLGSSTSQNPQAGVSFEESGSGNTLDVTVTLTSKPRAENVGVNCGADSTWDSTMTSAGQTVECTDVGTGSSVIVRADYQGKTAVIATYDT